MGKKSNKVKIEIWDGVKYIVARNEKGNIISRRKWSKSFNLSKAKEKLTKDNTFTENQSKYKLTNVKEIVDYSKNPKIKNSFVKVMWRVEGYVNIRGKRIQIFANSKYEFVEDIKDKRVPLSYMKEEARTSFMERISQAVGGGYDSESGMVLIGMGNAGIVREGIVRYETI